MVVKHHHATNEQWADVLSRLDGDTISGALVKTTKRHRSTVYRWKKRAEQVKIAAERNKNGRSIVSGLVVRNPSTQNSKKDMRKSRVKCVTVHCVVLMIGKFDPEYGRHSTEGAKIQFVRRLMKKYRLSVRRITHRGKKTRDKLIEVAATFSATIQYAIEETGVLAQCGYVDKADHVYNMDQTAVLLDMPPARTIDFIGIRDVDLVASGAANAFRVSGFLCASSSGRKLAPYIVFGGTPNGPVNHEVLTYEDGIVCTVQQNAFTDHTVMQDWIDQVWAPDIDSCRLLLLDSLGVHKMDSVSARLWECNTQVEFIPPGLTGICQPMDVAVMKIFKDQLRLRYLEYYLDNPLTMTTRQRRALIARLVKAAWDAVPSQTIHRGFVKCGILPFIKFYHQNFSPIPLGNKKPGRDSDESRMGRGRIKLKENGGREARQHKNGWVTYQFRLAAVISYEAVGINDTLDSFDPGLTDTIRETKRNSVYLWHKQKAAITEQCATEASGLKRCARKLGVATSLSADAEMDLLRWINEYRDVGAPVSSLMLRLRALRVAEETDVPRGFFEASREWQKGFLKRHSLSFRSKTRQGQISPKKAEEMVIEFTKKLRDRMDELQIDSVYNADQTPVFFEYIPKSTVEKKGAKTVWVRSGGRDKERLTCMVLGNSQGEKKKPFLVLKTTPAKDPATRGVNDAERHGFGARLWKEVQALQKAFDVQIYGNRTGWWNSDISEAFLIHHFDKRADMSIPVLLLWDDFSAHWTEVVLNCAKKLNVELMKIPPGYTSVCQPADVGWNQPLKQRIRDARIMDLQQQLDQAGGKALKLVPPDRKKVIGWVSQAWNDLKPTTIANGFACITKEPILTEEMAATYDDLADRLQALNLLDSSIGEVDSDIVDDHLDQESEE